MQRRFRFGTAAAGILAVLAMSETAFANHVPGHPGQNAAVAQYVEQVPTSSGSQATGFGKATNKPLPPAIQQQLAAEGGEDAALLKQISESSQYGAPQQTLKKKKLDRSDGAGAIPTEPEDTSATKALSAVRTVVTDGSEGRLIALLVVLLAITGFAVAAAGYRQRALRRPIGR